MPLQILSKQARLVAGCEGWVRAVAVDRGGNLAVGTLDDGVWLNTAGVWRHLSTEQGLSYKTVLSLYFDHGNTLWVGTDGGGLDRVIPTRSPLSVIVGRIRTS